MQVQARHSYGGPEQAAGPAPKGADPLHDGRERLDCPLGMGSGGHEQSTGDPGGMLAGPSVPALWARGGLMHPCQRKTASFARVVHEAADGLCSMHDPLHISSGQGPA